ncbi:protein kinase domain-containing protein [Ruminococcus difficilis]|uniref:non-specific serine/threonine protein kinase n=1 Tax=Ruminococcus difficilis TaxID=2763069 RepID=A0A934WUS0_9FIRM|nr:protein kinase [Ruminococcus difficilis]MBK6090322.1 protein kinase [Ruminococcus difficilis]
MSNYCYSCMNEIDGSYCPYCNKENVADSVVYRLKPGTVLNKKILVGNCIGEGGFGITYIGRDLTLDRRVAVKEYFPNGYVNRNNNVSQLVSATTDNQVSFFKKGLQNFLEEARKIAKLTNVSGIVDVREYFEENGTAYIVMEYLDGINLSAYLRQNGIFKPETIFQLMLPITYSLQKMHEEGIIHRDISPDNIMYLTDGTLKLTDFGSARYFSNAQKEMSVVVKQGYAPEEQYSKNGDQGPWTDVYGLCATMYKCITGKIPVDAVDRIKQDTLIPPSELGIQIPEPMQVTLMYGLAVFKNDRCKSMQELSYLMEKALANENIQVESADYYHRLNQTMIANSSTTFMQDFDNAINNRGNFNRQEVDPQSVHRNTGGYSYNRYTGQPDPYGYDNRYRDPSPGYQPPYNDPRQSQQNQNKNSGKTPIIIAVTVFLCVSLIAGTVIYLFMKYDTQPKDETITTATEIITVVETTANDSQEDSDDSAPDPAPAPQPKKTTPTEPPAPVRATPQTTASASDVLGDQAGHNYHPSNVLSNDGTCWCPKEGSGVGEWIKLDFGESKKINGLDIVNGYAGSEEQYKANSKVTKIRIEFSNGNSVTKSLSVKSVSNRKDSQHISFNSVTTSSVKITILSIEKGKECDDTCITYISETSP